MGIFMRIVCFLGVVANSIALIGNVINVAKGKEGLVVWVGVNCACLIICSIGLVAALFGEFDLGG